MENETNSNVAPEPVKEKVVYPKHWRRTFAVPLNEAERKFLQEAAAKDGKPLATWIREASKAMAKASLGRAQ